MNTRTYITLSTTISALFLLSSCNTEPTRDVQYYLDHPKELEEKLEQCKNNPGELMDTPNCKNAMQAHDHRVFDSNNKGMPKIKVPDKW